MTYVSTIGLEIHAHLKTRTKMFCDSLNDPNEHHANVNVCPVCLGHPGVLPTINKQAVEYVIKTGLALGGTIAGTTKFDRKNYFYPDLPKGYQISQYDEPLVSGGELSGVRIRRVHLEEDAGNLVHAEKESLVDFNRAGTPLMELVTEPDIKSPEEAVNFARELQRILRYLGVSDANMEKGEFRVEVNISLNMGTKVELKNLNSYKVVESATKYEIKRQLDLLESGKEVAQETRGWDEKSQKTVSQRSKEEAHDYRYFPEPDLPPFTTGAFDIEKLRAEIPELPHAKRERFIKEYALDAGKAEMLVDDQKTSEYFEEAASEYKARVSDGGYDLLFNYFMSDLRGFMNEHGERIEDIRVTPENFAQLVALAAKKTLTSRGAKDVLLKMLETGEDPENIVKKEGLETVRDEGLVSGTIQKIIAENPKAVEDFNKGKMETVQFLVGQAMKELRGKGDPLILRESIIKFLGEKK